MLDIIEMTITNVENEKNKTDTYEQNCDYQKDINVSTFCGKYI